MTPTSHSKPTVWDRVIEPWWAKLSLGVIMLLISWLQFVEFHKFESGEKKSMVLNRITMLLYDIGGKWLPIGLTLLVGIGSLAWAAYQVTRVKR